MRSTLTRKSKSLTKSYGMIRKMPYQVSHLNRMVRISDSDCILNIRVDRNTFERLCQILRELGGLSDVRYVSVEEQVVVFLSILAHHKKNRVVGFSFQRSCQSISNYMHLVLRVVIKLHGIFSVKPTPVLEDYVDPRWK